MAMNVTPFVGTDNFNMETFNNMISQINDGVNGEISDVLAQLGTKAKMQVGSYVGTGSYGADNPNTLTFNFPPKYLLIVGSDDDTRVTGDFLFWIAPAPTAMSIITTAMSGASSMQSNIRNVFSVSGNTLSWYYNTVVDDYSSSRQFNTNSKVFYWLAIG